MDIVPWKYANPYIDTRTCTKREMTFCGELVVIEQSPSEDIDLKHNTGHILWDASYVLTRYLELHVGKVYFAGKKCLELGAGTGLPGIVAGMLGASVILTDVSEALPLLHKNCDMAKARANAHIPPTKLDIKVQHYRWGTRPCGGDASTSKNSTTIVDVESDSVPGNRGSAGTAPCDPTVASMGHHIPDACMSTPHLLDTAFDVILCSEGIYDCAFHPALLKSFKILCGKNTVVYIAYKERALGEDTFVEHLTTSPAYNVEEISGEFLDPDFQDSRIKLLKMRRAR
eukprot:m.519351 g.519351  ORF g.519351 m.519351 type:complete len:286 (+) comp21944_c0_seq3:370-1227(+)